MKDFHVPTDAQFDYVKVMQRRLKLSDGALDIYCEQAYGAPLPEMSRFQVSRLIDAMKDWKAIPPEVQRALGQLDMFGNVA